MVLYDICSNGFINCTSEIGSVVVNGSNTVVGSMFATLLLILLILVVMCLFFGIPLELIAVVIIPMCLACYSSYGEFIAPLGIIGIYFGVLISKYWLFR